MHAGASGPGPDVSIAAARNPPRSPRHARLGQREGAATAGRCKVSRRAPASAALAALTLASIGPAAGRVERLIDVLDQRHGISVAGIYALAQDSAGFIWIGTRAGLFRYDGRDVRRWAGTPTLWIIERILAGTDGSVVVKDATGGLFQVTAGGMTAVRGADGEPLTDARDAVLDAEARLLVLREGSLALRDHGGGWRPLPAAAEPGERLSFLLEGDDGRTYLLTGRGVRRLEASGATPLVLEVPGGAHRALVTADGTVFASPFITRVVQSSPTGPVERFRIDGRVVDLVARGDVVWVSVDRFLAALRPGRPPEILRVEDGVASGGPLLVDREGVLWNGSAGGLMRFPEPEVVAWNEASGLPSSHVRWVARTTEGIWASTWGGVGRILGEGDPPGAVSEPELGQGKTCVDAGGRLWIGESHLTMRAEGRFHRYLPRLGYVSVGCAPASDGGVWLPTGRGLFLTRPEGGPPRRIEHGPPGYADGRWWQEVLEDRDGRLWLTSDETVCHAPARDVRAGVAVEWRCREIPGTYTIRDIVQVASGALWIASDRGGVHRGGPGGWEPLPGSGALPTPGVGGLRPSPSGGIWVAAHAGVFRVLERPDLPAGWEVVEQLGRWHGLRQVWAEDLWEDPDGTLWLANWAGVTRVPPGARDVAPGPPPLVLTSVATDGEEIGGRSGIELPYRRNRLEIRFAALSYRDPGRIRYQYRTGPDRPWVDAAEPSLRFVDLPSGRHAVEMRASLDGARWSDPPLRLAYRVLRPWYLQAWALALAFLLLALALYGAYRVRLAMLLRLERQRATIAMDLHDEMGSGLGSIGVLAELAAETATQEEDRRTLAERIARSAEELSGSLADIVWSLRREAGDLAGLATQIAERGGAMAGPALRFDVRFPEPWPSVRLSLPARRAVQRIAVEAMHNVVRHAGATRMTLGIAPEGSRWRLWVEDDGRGLPPEAEGEGGLGIESMRTRAAELGAELRWSRPPQGGTRVDLWFHPGGGGLA
jgi:signal transduction histidine kinase/ligand-binding sensor domain-containing protein